MNNPDLTYISPDPNCNYGPDATNSEWNYHRNGVSGIGFRVRYVEGAVNIEFFGGPPDGDYDSDASWMRPVIVPENLCEELGDDEPHRKIDCFGGPKAHAWLVNAGLVAARSDLKERGTFLVMYHEDNGFTDTPVALLKVDKLPDVRFMYNSWRPEWLYYKGMEPVVKAAVGALV